MIKIISVDFQNDFTEPNGFAYKTRPSVEFVKKTLIPFFRKNKIKVFEIISDYRKIPLSSRGFFCQPGEWGYESEIPKDIKDKNIWIKCLHSPLWIRKNIGKADTKPGKPYQDPKAFSKWIESTVGKPEDNNKIILIGLTVNCCLLSLAQELYWRGYHNAKILEEATDDYMATAKEKNEALRLIQTNKWADIIKWKDLKKEIEK